MDKIYRVSYILGGITERTDDFSIDGNPDIRDTDIFVEAIAKKFNGVWGVDVKKVEILSVVVGHYEKRLRPGRVRLPSPMGYRRVFVEDGGKY